jgi:hypothetical protein
MTVTLASEDDSVSLAITQPALVFWCASAMPMEFRLSSFPVLNITIQLSESRSLTH